MKRRILTNDDTSILDELKDIKTNLFLLQANEKANDLLKKTTVMHILLAKRLWQYKIRYRSSILDTNRNNKNNIIKQQLKFIEENIKKIIYVLGKLIDTWNDARRTPKLPRIYPDIFFKNF